MMIRFINKRVKGGSEFVHNKVVEAEPVAKPKEKKAPVAKKTETVKKTEVEIKDKKTESHGRKDPKSDGKPC